MPKSVLMVAVMLTMLVACSSVPEVPPQESAQGLAGTSWRLVKFEGGDGAILAPDDRNKYTLGFDAGGSVVARIDCNRGRATWKSVSPGQLELGAFALTRAVCPPGSLHETIARQWPNVRSYVLRNGHLYLSLMADGGIYEFEPVTAHAQQAAAIIENTYWKLMRIGSKPVTASDSQRELHLVLHSDNQRVTGADGCNRFTGGYSLAGQKLTFSKIASTMMACANGIEQERAFHGVLGNVSGWRVEGAMLELLDSAGTSLAQFESRPMP